MAPLLDRLTSVRRSGGGWVARCPAHDDRNPSLSITAGEDGRALLHCHAGCTTESIVAALGLTLADLFPRTNGSPAAGTARRVVEREGFESRGTDGTLHATHTRIDYSDGSKAFLWPKGTVAAKVPLYRSEDIPSFDPAAPVIVTEGERKADKLRAAGFAVVALAAGASVEPDPEVLAPLTGFRITLWPDNDPPGHKIIAHVARAIRDLAAEVRIVRWPEAPPGGDAADFLERHSAEECRSLIAAAEPYPFEPPGWGSESMDVLDLLAAEHAEIVWVIPDILPEGTAILASNPKIGKSAMIYQLSAELALAGEFLGRRLAQRPALYFALEDGERRSKERAAAALADRRPPRGALAFRWAAPKLGAGLEAEIAGWLDAHPGGVVFLDTLQKVRPVARGNVNAYQLDVAEFAGLQDIVRRRPGATVVVVLHLRKARDNDFLARVGGTLGLTGSADTIVVLERDRHRDAATLHVTGRDVGEQEVALRFDGIRWSLDAGRIPGASPERQEVFDLIAELGPVWPSAIAAEINSRGGETTREAVKRLVEKLGASSLVSRTQRGYELAGAIRDDQLFLRYPVRLSTKPVPPGSTRGLSGAVEEPEVPEVPPAESLPEDGSGATDGGPEPEWGGFALVPALDEPAEPDAHPPCFSDPDAFRDHQLAHSRSADAWRCRACEETWP
jgi:hypothetical protein